MASTATEPGAWPRPAIHFTPERGWMNDPNGLVVVGDVHHLFFQHNPAAPRWGDIHWGHATSTDLLHWQERPIVLAPDEHGHIFSGSIVRDVTDTAGFGRDVLVAVFTQHLDHPLDHPLGYVECQSLAYSLDAGETFHTYDGNPVLRSDERDIRDPKVVRVDGDAGPVWSMALAVGREIRFFVSDDLRAWTQTSRVVPPCPWDDALIECPDLVRFGGRDDGEWVLLYSVDPRRCESPAERHVRWVAGRFDGRAFDLTGPGGVLDGGAHLYAAVTWARDDGPVLIGWMDEDDLPGRDPATAWCGRQSLARRLELTADGELVQQPILPARASGVVRRARLEPGAAVTIDVGAHCFVIELSGARPACSLRLVGDVAEATLEIGEGSISVTDATGDRHATAARMADGLVVVVDAGSTEIFSGDRRRSISSVDGVGVTATTLTVTGAAAAVGSVDVTEFASST